MNKKFNITNNSDMESLYFLIPLFFIIIFSFPLNIRLKSCINITKNESYLVLYFYKIKIVIFKIVYRKNKLYVTTKRRKKEVEILVDIKQIYFIDQFLEHIKQKIQFKEIMLNTIIGSFDAKNTAIYCGIYSSIVSTIFCFIKNKEPYCLLKNNIKPGFNKSIFLNCAFLSLNTTLFDLLYSLVISLFDLRRRSHERAKQNR